MCYRDRVNIPLQTLISKTKTKTNTFISEVENKQLANKDRNKCVKIWSILALLYKSLASCNLHVTFALFSVKTVNSTSYNAFPWKWEISKYIMSEDIVVKKLYKSHVQNNYMQRYDLILAKWIFIIQCIALFPNYGQCHNQGYASTMRLHFDFKRPKARNYNSALCFVCLKS